MQQARNPSIQVVISGHGVSNSNGAGERLAKALSVDEALQFSPMTSAPIFGLDSILRPDVGQPSLANLSSTHDRKAAGEIIDTLDDETQANAGESTRLETTRRHLQEILSGDMTEYEFKLPSRSRVTHNSLKAQLPDTESLSRGHLGPFAKMVLDSTDVRYRYPSPVTPSPKKKLIVSKSLPSPTLTENVSAARIPESSHHTESKATLGLQKPMQKPVVLVPSLPLSSQPNEYVHIRDQSPSKRRKLNTEDDEKLAALRLKDQKEEADAALVKLQELLQEVFEAEDQLEPDTSATEPQSSSKMFRLPKAIDGLGPVLSSETHSLLQTAMQKVTGYGRLRDIPTEYLNRIQKLCEPPVISAQTPDLKLEHVPAEYDTEMWLRKLDDMRNALLAICTLLHTMSGEVTIKDLCPEDVIQAIPNVLNHVFDDCLIPVVECRPNARDAELFTFFSAHRNILAGLVHQTKKVLHLLARFLSNVDVAEGTITATEFLATKLIFVENAHSDRDSTLGFQKYEAVRRGSMDVLAKIFAKYPEQRPFILDEILVSLEKLPSTRQSARQFKLIDGKHIQLLSALVMQLVQTTALQKSSKGSRRPKRRLLLPKFGQGEGSESEDTDDEADDDGPRRGTPLELLSDKVEPLFDNALRSAQYITKFIVQRAMTSTKTGDQPYRNLLDLFTGDLVSVLGSTDWPAAELLLRVLASQMIGLADHDKSPANAKNMALELLGWMGCAISDLTSSVQHLIPSMDEGDSELSDYLRQLFDEHLNRSLHAEDVVSVDGPYRIVLENLQERDLGNWQLSSARGYVLAQWAKNVCSFYYDPENRGNTSDGESVDHLARTLRNMLSDPRWLESHNNFERIGPHHARFAYLLTLLHMGFCKAFDKILKVLLNSITSDQAKVRSRSLKSVIQMLEKDPTLLDRDDSVTTLILRCSTDSSPMVRDSALSLIAKCITLRPALEEDGCRTILSCSADPTVGVRKRCIGSLKDIYLQTSRKDLKIAIADNLLQRITDMESSVVTQARQVLEEIWFGPFHHPIDSIQDSPQTKVSLGELVDLIVGSVEKSDAIVTAFEKFVKSILSDDTKAASANFKVCKAIVAAMFERIIDHADSPNKPTLQALLQSVTVFAKANAKLFTPDQLETLHPYIGHLSTADDLLLFRSVVVIYRCVLPYLSTAHNTLLKEIQNDLFKSVSKLARTELNEVMACLWTIDRVLQNTERLVKLTISVLKGIAQAKTLNFDNSSKTDALGRVRSYIRIAGCVGKHCDLEKYYNFFRQSFPTTQATSVSGLMVNFIAPFALPQYPLELRIMALESLGSICQTWPAQYSQQQARVALSSVFEGDNPDLQNIILKSFLEFFSIHEGKAETLVQTNDSAADAESSARLAGSLKASENDGAAALIAQQFLQNMLHAALSKQDTYALTAIELIASINRQGLIHPKECAGVLVALETSTNPTISKIAFDTHKMLHEQHESMFDREYMRAVQDAFHYQRDVVGDPSGAFVRPYTSKLAPLFDIIKVSNSKYQRKFLTNLCTKVDFELRKLDVSKDPPEHLLLSRFVSQNIAFFEYAQIAEILPTIACIERIVAATGTIVAHAIETDLFQNTMEPINGNSNAAQSRTMDGSTVSEEVAAVPTTSSEVAAAGKSIDGQLLRQLATAAGSLLMLWEARSYLRRLYGINFHARQKEGKGSAKELNRPPSKVQGVTGDRFWEVVSNLMHCLDSTETMVTTCRDFALLLSIDDELKVAGDDDRGSHDTTGEGDEMGILLAAAGNSKPGKRKSSVSAGGTPKKKARGSKPLGKKRMSTDIDDELASD
ncbi:sister chromatid cohesion protein Mis4 [Histoplasma capsulatum G186AR]|uniref:Sister chromatid cohesion protein n=1 Tax=Ajellomyces capsulatus TaxID=5037 RepID=A0A8H8D9M4_AJECA|nr:sister chromatid cohesion protein Mis4 [Histoplasma capsulatum]QSS75687.1 sister chromatid cohesion protein Mis4 [Histoplasma capsulatum G186AR]